MRTVIGKTPTRFFAGILPEGSEVWTDGPRCAYSFADGSDGDYISGWFHRDDGPAIVTSDGHQYWFCQNTWLIEDDHLTTDYRPNPREAQEFICRNRPDLIGQIKGLFPDLREKYFHELELSRVDL
jgi:hypothetical protein